MLTEADPQLAKTYDEDLRRLATLSGAGITIAGLVLLAIIAYAGWASNQSATARESTLLQNALNRGIARALNEQKSVAWWDDAVVKITDAHIDSDFVNSNFGVFLTETYGHDEVYIINGENRPLYAFTGGAQADAARFEERRTALAPVIAQARGESPASTGLKVRPDAFGADQSNYRTLTGAVEAARWAGHILSVDGRLAVVAALTIVPNVDMSLLKGASNLLVSVTYIDSEYVTALGRSLLMTDLAISPEAASGDGVVAEPLDGDDGTHAGFLTWKTHRPGQVFLNFILPLVAMGVLATAVLANGMLRQLKKSSQALAMSELQSRHDARHDTLSDLPNRPHFAEKLDQALSEAAAGGGGKHVIVAYVDIDRFKDVNDTLGHHAGDALIQAVAGRLKAKLRPQDLLSRYGGDEFAILWSASEPNAAALLAERILSAFSTRFDVNGQSLLVTASAGIATSTGSKATGDDLMRQADIALYEGKTQGRNRAIFFSGDMATRVEERRSIELDLQAALENDGLRLNYQPIIASKTGAIAGVEALLRWRHPVRGEMSPATFIPIAEHSGLMPELGEWVLRRAMIDARLWPNLQVSVNLSPVQFRQVDLEAVLQRLVSEHGADPRRFILEITEGVLMESCDRTSATLDAIHRMGFLTALDDFGTGYSSLSYLCNFRFDKIKIDRSFVAGMSKSQSYQKIVHAVVALGKGLGMEIVAEGVETEAEVAIMTGLGCGELQGYYFSKPVETDALCRLLESYVPKASATRQVPRADQPAQAATG
jgi:diguanylate cyclase (GGDEF)-like protein